jgi:hypothetical protein
MLSEESRLKRENQLLRKLVVDLSAFIKDLFEHMPDDIQELSQVQSMIELVERLVKVYGSPLSPPGNS